VLENIDFRVIYTEKIGSPYAWFAW